MAVIALGVLLVAIIVMSSVADESFVEGMLIMGLTSIGCFTSFTQLVLRVLVLLLGLVYTPL